MGQILHGSARTTAAIRRAIQHSQESLIVLSKRHGINPKTVANQQVRLRPARDQGKPDHSLSLPGSPDRSRAIQNPHCAD